MLCNETLSRRAYRSRTKIQSAPIRSGPTGRDRCTTIVVVVVVRSTNQTSVGVVRLIALGLIVVVVAAGVH